MKKSLKASYLLLTLLLITSVSSWAAEPGAGKVKTNKDENAVYYTIIKHDTLWDISQRFLQDPFQWPYLWKLNTYIKNPDLIYPGDVVKVVPLAVEEGEAKPAGIDIDSLPKVFLSDDGKKVVTLQPEEPVAEEHAPKGPSYGNANLRKDGFISRKDFKPSGIIMKAMDDKLLLSAGDKVFLSFEDKGSVHEGTRYTIYNKGVIVRHPITGKKIGNMIDILGSLAVTKDSGVVEGRIKTAVAEIEVGAKLMPYTELPREVRMVSSDAPLDGYVIASLSGNKNLSKGDILYIDKGTKDGVVSGRSLKVLRNRDVARDPVSGKKVELPPLDIGSIVVIKADKNTSSCIVIKSLRTILTGDRVSAGIGM